ncbi:MAG: asparagine synthase (glutamine-hydrolyzing) [Bryobacterales bacterium]|nr:asparagine synthase (glutamine-hydrolyzing) [Bryobacterales bacterium]
MCGIAGFVSNSASTDPSAYPRLVRRMTEEIAHRGPDDTGVFCDSHAALGHRRLSIIDLSAGRQPMFNEAGNLSIIYNGEVYNHADLRPELEANGHVYRSHCDTETILHAYEQYGPDCVTRFRGMFAFAIWDSTSRTLFCARDRLGIKPLYYYSDGSLFAFASEIKALLAHPEISARFEASLLPEYLSFGYTSGEHTLFQGIRKLMPGHTLRISVDGFQPEIRQYWQLPVTQTPIERSSEEWIAECRRLLEESVRLRLMSDVPLGMFLSGGLDSSAIAAIMQRMVPEPIKTFAVGYSEAQFSELSYARDVARRIGADHREVVIGMDEFFNTLPNMIWHEDEPVSWPSSVSLYHVSALAAKTVKVVLTGEGSDELFAGYGRYRYQLMNHEHMRVYGLVPAGVRSFIRSQIARSPLLGANLRRKLKHTVLGRTDDLQSLYLENFYGAFSAHDVGALVGPGHESAAAYAAFVRHFEDVPHLPYLERLLYADKKTYLVELLMKQDQMSMAASIESRVPFLDHHFVEFASQVPSGLKLRGKTGKYILKEAVTDLLPAAIIHRTKMGFPTPLRQWLMEPKAAHLYDFLLEKQSLLGEYLDGDELRKLISRHRSSAEDATDRIWNLLNLQLWGDIFLNGRRDRWTEGMFPAVKAQVAV